MDGKCVYFEVGNTFLYRISIGFMVQPIRSKFSVVFLAAWNSVLVFAFNLPLHVSPIIDIGTILHCAPFHRHQNSTITRNINIQPKLSAKLASCRAKHKIFPVTLSVAFWILSAAPGLRLTFTGRTSCTVSEPPNFHTALLPAVLQQTPNALFIPIISIVRGLEL